MSSVLNDDIDYEPLYEGFIKELQDKYHITIKQSDIHWRGFWSQGDGLSFDFEINDSEVAYFLEAIDAPEAKNFSDFWLDETIFTSVIKTSKNNFATNYCHSNTRDISLWFEYYQPSTGVEEFGKIINAKQDIEKYIKEWYVGVCDEFYKRIEEHYYENAEDTEREEWDDKMTISDRIDAMIDPEMNIEKVVEMIKDAKTVSNSNIEANELIETFIKNFNNDYLIIKKG